MKVFKKTLLFLGALSAPILITGTIIGGGIGYALVKSSDYFSTTERVPLHYDTDRIEDTAALIGTAEIEVRAGKDGVETNKYDFHKIGGIIVSKKKTVISTVNPTPRLIKVPVLKKTIEKGQTESIDFQSITQYDSHQVQGYRKITQNGVAGQKQSVTEIFSVHGKEQSRNRLPDEVLEYPIDEITVVGTAYRIGAECNDGWLSDAIGSGACSHHLGVECWNYSDGLCRVY